MQFYNTLHFPAPEGRTSVALGYFDGLHKGHKAVISRAVSLQAEGLSPAVFTFSMGKGHPDKKPASAYRLLTGREKKELLESWGVSLTVCPDFMEFCAMDAAAFVDKVLVQGMHAAAVCCGEDFRFGYKASAGVDELALLCEQRGILVNLVGAVTRGGRRISSTWIRALLRGGEVAEASRLLGRAFGYDFTVVGGKQLGRKLDFPTINQPIPASFTALRHGVYASLALAGGSWLPSVTNVGVRPTVGDGEAVNSETYICGFEGDLYGQHVRVRLLRFLRPEQKFASLEGLRAQIAHDAEESVHIGEDYLRQKGISPLQPGNTMV